MSLYVGRLPLSYFGYKELEVIFRKYGRIVDSSMYSGGRYGMYHSLFNVCACYDSLLQLPIAYGFVDYENSEDAYHAVRNEHGRVRINYLH